MLPTVCGLAGGAISTCGFHGQPSLKTLMWGSGRGVALAATGILLVISTIDMLALKILGSSDGRADRKMSQTVGKFIEIAVMGAAVLVYLVFCGCVGFIAKRFPHYLGTSGEAVVGMVSSTAGGFLGIYIVANKK